jgi:hypothetical protein
MVMQAEVRCRSGTDPHTAVQALASLLHRTGSA